MGARPAPLEPERSRVSTAEPVSLGDGLDSV